MTDALRSIDDLRREELEKSLAHYANLYREIAREHRTTTDPKHRVNLEAQLRDTEEKYDEAYQAYQQLQGIRKFKPKLGAERNLTAWIGWGVAALLLLVLMIVLWQLTRPPQDNPEIGQVLSPTNSPVVTAILTHTPAPTAMNIPLTNTLVPTTTAIPPTNTPAPPTNMPVVTALEEALTHARAGVTTNTEWQALYPEGFVQVFDGIEMVLVPAGCFQMGSDNSQIELAVGMGGERGWITKEEYPTSSQCIYPFWIDKYEVTQQQYQSQMGSNPSDPKIANYPVNNVTWFNARDYCSGLGSRLPSEVEWEYAARGPESWIFPWGNYFSAENVAYNNISHLVSVDAYLNGRSWIGAFQLGGNVWEWVTTAHGIDTNGDQSSGDEINQYLYPYSATDGRELNSDDTRYIRVIRGGSFAEGMDNMRSARRGGAPVQHAWYNLGFRCARSLD